MRYNQSQLNDILTAAGFELKQAVKGMTVIGYHCTMDGVTFMCAHDGSGYYPAERIAAVIAKTATKIEQGA